MGMALDCCARLMSDLAGDVFAAGSPVGPAGTVPSTCVLGVIAGSDLSGSDAATGGGFLSEQAVMPTPTMKIRARQTEKKRIAFGMVIYLTHKQGDQDDDRNRHTEKQQQQ
jgi:hypothetical protein